MQALRMPAGAFALGALRVQLSLRQGNPRQDHKQPHGDHSRHFPGFAIAGKSWGPRLRVWGHRSTPGLLGLPVTDDFFWNKACMPLIRHSCGDVPAKGERRGA